MTCIMTFNVHVTALISKSKCFVSQGMVRKPSGEVGNSVAVLLQISFCICVPKIIKIQNYCKLL